MFIIMYGDVCTAEWLHEHLQVTSSSPGLDDVSGHSGVLVLDCRSVDEYMTCHVTGSLPVTVTSIMLRRLRSGSASVSAVIGGGDASRTMFIERWKSDRIVLYDNIDSYQSSSTPNVDSASTTILSTILTRLKSDGCRVAYLQGGFATFRDKYSHLCIAGTHHNNNNYCNNRLYLNDAFSSMRLSSSAPSSLSSLNLVIASDTDTCNGREIAPTPLAPPSGGLPFPVEVIPYLYLGDAETSRDLNCLRRHNIRYIVNVTEDVPNSFVDDTSLTYMRIPITDHCSQSLTSFFCNAIIFIDEGRQSQCSVLVHCLAGISRSVTVTVAYLMYFMSMSLEDAFDYLRRIRPNIAPNFSFMGQLLDFEKALQYVRNHCACHKSSPQGPCRRCLRDVTSRMSLDSSDRRLTVRSYLSSELSSETSDVSPNIMLTLPCLTDVPHS